MNETTKDRILSRRARFVGAALATAGLTAGGIQACGAAQPCLSLVPVDTPDAGPEEGAVTDPPDAAQPPPEEAGLSDPPPMVCLTPTVEPEPEICLRVPRPEGE